MSPFFPSPLLSLSLFILFLFLSASLPSPLTLHFRRFVRFLSVCLVVCPSVYVSVDLPRTPDSFSLSHPYSQPPFPSFPPFLSFLPPKQSNWAGKKITHHNWVKERNYNLQSSGLVSSLFCRSVASSLWSCP